MRPDRTGPFGKAFLAPIAPGLFTKTANARGAVMGQANGSPISDCDDAGFFTLPIVLSPDGTTQVILPATGIRNGGSIDGMQATIAGIPVASVSAGPNPDSAGDDLLVLQPGAELTGLGETDLVLFVQGHASNSVRINIHE